jgi:hypothetical protein
MKKSEVWRFMLQAIGDFIALLEEAMDGNEESHKRVTEVLDPVSKNRLQMIRAQRLRGQYYGDDPGDSGTTPPREG